MAQVPMDTTSLQVPSEHGLPDASDRVVRELDVYVMNGELGSGAQVRRASLAAAASPPPPPPSPPRLATRPSRLPAQASPATPLLQTYLLQFPLRPPWRPYHTDAEGLRNVKLKPKASWSRASAAAARAHAWRAMRDGGLLLRCQCPGLQLLRATPTCSAAPDVPCALPPFHSTAEQVKKLQADVPLDTASRNYNDNAEESRCAGLGRGLLAAAAGRCQCPAHPGGRPGCSTQPALPAAVHGCPVPPHMGPVCLSP